MTVPETRIYSIHTSGREIHSQSQYDRVLIIQASAADYLKQPFIAKRTSPYEMILDKNAKWEAAPLRIVSDELATAMADSGLFSEVRETGVSADKAYVLSVYLRNFEYLHDNGSDMAILNLDISLLSPEGHLLFRDNIETKRSVESHDYGSLARVLSSALGEAVNASVQKISEKFD
jgi:ABC-type uncharacterized transport system auxiliary subunit